MHRVAQDRSLIHPLSEEERRLVREELAELLKSPHFANSKRYPALLSYIVEKSLAGQSDELKERVLGVEVFHRPPDYDSNSDTVVRVAAGEVRRRLALIYHESDGEHAIEISLPTGSYVPDFCRNLPVESLVPSIAQQPVVQLRTQPPTFAEPLPALLLNPSRRRWRMAAIGIGAAILVAGLAALFAHRQKPGQTAMDLFWQPIRSSSSGVMLCPGAMVRAPNTTYGLAMAQRTDDYTFTSMATTVAIADLVDLFSKTHIEYMVRPSSTITLTDLREHPAVLIGAYNNEWTLNIQKELRYRFADDPARKIYDTTNPSITWSRPHSVPFLEQDDFAVIARFHSKLTDGPVVIIAGIGKNGTGAAAEFVRTPRYLDLLNQRSTNWTSKNVELVLKIGVVHGQGGVPSIEAMYLW